MRTLLRLFFSGLLLGAGGAYADDSVDTLLGQLRKESEKYCAGLKPEQRQRFGADPMTALAASLARIEGDVRTGNYESADQQTRQFAGYVPTPEAARLSSLLLAALQSVREKRDAESIARSDALVEKTGRLCLAAKTEKELDDLLGELASLRSSSFRGGGNNDVLQRAAQKLESATRFTRRWQDYLAQLNAGNANAARQIMQELSNDGSGYYPIVPRSELLARVNAASGAASQPAAERTPAPPGSIDVEIKSLDDLPGALEKIRQFCDGRSVSTEDAAYLQNLTAISSALGALESGNIGTVFRTLVSGAVNTNRALPEKYAPLLARLRSELLTRALPRYLELSPERAPKAGENPADYVLRVARESRAAGDWLVLSRALDAYQRIAFENSAAPEWLPQERTALGQYLVGRNMEQAGEYDSALISYQQALHAPGNYVPMEDIAARVKRVRKAADEKRLAELRARQQQAEEMRRQQSQAPAER